MRVVYSSHLKLRLVMRGIPKDLPRIVFKRARRRYFDKETGLEVAVLKTAPFGKMRDVAVTYRLSKEHAHLITIHPLKPAQLKKRLVSGRWRSIK